MRYQQYRLAKRNGEIVQQTRYVECITTLAHPRWQFWNWSTYKADYEYGDWMTMPMVELFDWKQGDRVLVKQSAGFHKGAVGTVEFVEPSGKKVWVKRDGSTNAVYYHIDELEPEPKSPITSKMVQQLREETDHPMMECKKALYACDGDHERAKKWLADGIHFRSTI